VVFLQVLFRYALYAPLDWSEELAMVLFQWCCLIGAAIAVRRGTHYHLDILTSRLPESFKIPAGILASLCIFAMGYLMVHWGIQMMLLIAPQKYAILGFSIAYTYLAIPVSGTLIIFFQIPIFRKQIRSFSTR
jgi:TRAP-type C4-dicarboxylate transport system permease small subunit